MPVPGTDQTVALPEGVAVGNIVFKNLTWVPQELRPSQLVIYHEYLDRVMNPLCMHCLNRAGAEKLISNSLAEAPA